MVRKMTEWSSKRGPIAKIMLPDGVKGDTAPLALERWYDYHEVGCHLGNVGIHTCLLSDVMRWTSGTISTNLDVIWGISVERT